MYYQVIRQNFQTHNKMLQLTKGISIIRLSNFHCSLIVITSRGTILLQSNQTFTAKKNIHIKTIETITNMHLV